VFVELLGSISVNNALDYNAATLAAVMADKL
jgi:hypothetical protein